VNPVNPALFCQFRKYGDSTNAKTSNNGVQKWARKLGAAKGTFVDTGVWTFHIRPGIARSDFADWVEETYFEAMQDLHLAPFVQGV